MATVHNQKNSFALLIAFLIPAALSLTVCLLFGTDTAFGAKNEVDGWMIVQDHKDLGHNTIYVTHDSVKVVNQNLGFTFVMAPPYKAIPIFRTDEHIIFNGDSKEFQHATLLPGIVYAKPTVYTMLKKIGEENFEGLHVDKFKSLTAEDEIWTIGNISLAPPVLDAIHSYYQIQNPIFPFRKISFVGANHSKHKNLWLTSALTDTYQGKNTFLETRSAKKMKFTAKDFAIPTGYTSVNNVAQVFLSRSGASKFDSIVQDFMLPDETKKPSTPVRH